MQQDERTRRQDMKLVHKVKKNGADRLMWSRATIVKESKTIKSIDTRGIKEPSNKANYQSCSQSQGLPRCL